MAARVHAGERFITHVSGTPTTATIHYVGNYTPPPSPLLPYFPAYNDLAAVADFSSQLRGLHNGNVPQSVDKNLFLALSVNRLPCTKSSCLGLTRLVTSMNNVTMVLPTTMDILQAYYRGVSGVYSADFPDLPFDYTHWKKGEVGSGPGSGQP